GGILFGSSLFALAPSCSAPEAQQSSIEPRLNAIPTISDDRPEPGRIAPSELTQIETDLIKSMPAMSTDIRAANAQVTRPRINRVLSVNIRYPVHEFPEGFPDGVFHFEVVSEIPRPLTTQEAMSVRSEGASLAPEKCLLLWSRERAT